MLQIQCKKVPEIFMQNKSSLKYINALKNMCKSKIPSIWGSLVLSPLAVCNKPSLNSNVSSKTWTYSCKYQCLTFINYKINPLSQRDGKLKNQWLLGHQMSCKRKADFPLAMSTLGDILINRSKPTVLHANNR